MRRFLEIFGLELRALVRSRSLAILLVAAVAWMLAMPYVVHGDGTVEGAREIYVRYSLGGVFVLLAVSLLAAATGTIARERSARRLQLTMVRPVRYFTIALGKVAALSVVGAFVLAVAAGVLCVKVDVTRPCSHVLSPILPSPQEEAQEMYEVFMRDPETPAAVKKAKKSAVLRLLTQRAIDHYQTITTNAMVSWRFPLAADGADTAQVRMRFSAQFDMRRDVCGRFTMDDLSVPVSNVTQSVVLVPLGQLRPGLSGELSFRNEGDSALMLRPRRDINLLLRADSFLWNLVRAYLELVALLTLIIAFGVALSSALGRPVALFVAIVTLVVSAISPSVLEQYPDPLDANAVDRIGLVMTRFAAQVTHPVSALSPLEALSNDECVEWTETARTLLADVCLLPLLLALLAALVMPRKQEEA